MDIKIPHSLLKNYLQTKAKPQTIAEKLSLCGPTVDRVYKSNNDWLYEIEIISNRVDTASAFGVAREASAILPQFDIPAKLVNNPYKQTPPKQKNLPTNKPLKVQILDNSLVPRFTAISLKNVHVKQSPSQVKDQLKLSGQRPLNNIIDISNELTIKYGQPVHIFDLDKIKNSSLTVRKSKKGEKITTLDNQTITLKGGDIIIQDGQKRLIDLCGIMGGLNSRVDKNTKNILLFVQNYNHQLIRRTSLYTQHRTLAAQLFEKQPDPELVMPALLEGIKLLKTRAKTVPSSTILDIYPNPPQEKSVNIDLSWLNQFIGHPIKPSQAKNILHKLGFKTQGSKKLTCQVPSFRHQDINNKYDLAEEITRVYGYYRLPGNLPNTKPVPQLPNPLLTHESQARRTLSHLGFTEIYNSSLVSKKLFKKTNISLKTKFKLQNPLSEDQQYMRTSLIPSLLQNLSSNQGKTPLPHQIFELANIYLPSKKTALSQEQSTLSIATHGPALLNTKGYLEAVLYYLKADIQFQLAKRPPQPFNTAQTTKIVDKNTTIGYLGTLKPKVTHNFDFNQPVTICQLNFQALNQSINPIREFQPIPETSIIIQDLTIKSTQPVSTLINKLQTHSLIIKVDYLSQYKNKHSFRLHFNSSQKNLTQSQVNKVKKEILSHNFSTPQTLKE